MPTIWGYGNSGSEPGTMTGWGYPSSGLLTLHSLNVGDVLVLSDAVRFDIPNWLRRVRITDSLFEIGILRISGARAFRDDSKYSITILRID